MFKKVLFSSLTAVAMMALVVAPALAVQYGQPDGTAHPYVGLVVFYDSDHVPLWRCTGTLISGDVLLTAGHCTGIDLDLGFGPSFAQVWFDPGPIPTGNWPGAPTSCTGFTGYPCSGGVTGIPHPHPGWNGFLTIPNTHDVGVVVLDDSQPGPYASVAPVGSLDGLATKRGIQDVQFTIVGYGLQSVKPVTVGLRQRFVGTVSLVNLRSALTDGYNLHYSSDPGNGNGPGGTCFGDSGGPVFSEGLIVAVNSFVLNSNCKGAGFGFRTDTQLVADFLSGY